MRNRSMFRILPFVLLLAGISVPACAQQMTLYDGTFSPDHWSLTLFWLEGLGGHMDAAQVATGGDPGSFRAVEVWINQSKVRYNRVCGFSAYSGDIITPAQVGGILSVDYSEDAILLVGYNQGQGGGPALRQNGIVYISESFVMPETYWVHHAYPGLTQDDFYDPQNTVQHPDFSPSGGPIEFGFFRGNSATSDDPYYSKAGIDNWTFVLHTGGPTPVQPSTWGAIKALF